jgi:phenylacetate-CoA ligase
MSLRSFIAKKISYPLQDVANGTSILATLHDMNISQSWPLEKQKDYQFEKFLQLLQHSVENVPYYRNLFREEKLVLADIKEPVDIGKIPILTKEIAREKNRELRALNLDQMKVMKGVTGGTTGPPLKILRDVPDRNFTWAAFYRWYHWMGMSYGDSMLQLWGTPTVLHVPFSTKLRTAAKDFYYNRHIVDSFHLNEKTIPGVLDKIEKYRPVFIRGYLSALIQVSEYILENQITLSYAPRALSSTTETLYPAYKKLIETAFRSKLYDQYGCGECNSIAFDAGDKNGLYIATEHALLEILDKDLAPAGLEQGRFIVTNLDNLAMPFIRYENGDSGRFSMYDESSEIRLPAVKEVLGRTADTITLKDGSRVHGVFFTDILNELFTENPESIHRFQVFQNEPGRIEFRIEKATPPPKDYVQALNQALLQFFVEVDIVTMPTLPKDKTGKFRYILSKQHT